MQTMFGARVVLRVCLKFEDFIEYYSVQ